jgi:hypothetical protein
MKKTRFLFALVGFGAITFGLAYAGEPSRPSAEHASHPNHPTTLRPVEREHGKLEQSKQKHAALPDEGRAPLNPPARKVLPNEVHPTESKKAASAKNGPMMNKTGSPHEQPDKLAPAPVLAHSRNATAALVGRVLVTSNAKYSAGPLAGAAAQRKP